MSFAPSSPTASAPSTSAPLCADPSLERLEGKRRPRLCQESTIVASGAEAARPLTIATAGPGELLPRAKDNCSFTPKALNILEHPFRDTKAVDAWSENVREILDSGVNGTFHVIRCLRALLLEIRVDLTYVI